MSEVQEEGAARRDGAEAPSTRPRRSRLRTVNRLVLGPLVLMAAVFAATYHSAGVQSADVSGAQSVDFREECQKEGCSKEEIKELWSSYQSECFDENCWTEEVFELSGGDHYLDNPYYGMGLCLNCGPPSRIPAMFDAFRDRLGKTFTPAPMKAGYTNQLWHKVLGFLDGKTITIPVAKCDPDYTNCTPPKITW